MNAVALDLRDFPADVQDLLRTRAVQECRPMADVIREYTLECARKIVAAAEPPVTPEPKHATAA